MEIILHARLGAVAQKSFDTNEGEHVEYNEGYFQHKEEDGTYSVVKVNTKQDLVPLLGKIGNAKIQVQENGKFKLVSFIPERSSGESEEE